MPALVTAIALLLLACGPVPGGVLFGKPAPIPPDWADVVDDGRAICEIESRAEDPHSIQLECFIYEGALYVQSHRWALASWWPVDSWATIWIEEPDVKVRIGQGLFELKAVHVTGREEREPILSFRGYDPVPEGIALFRFEPRS